MWWLLLRDSYRSIILETVDLWIFVSLETSQAVMTIFKTKNWRNTFLPILLVNSALYFSSWHTLWNFEDLDDPFVCCLFLLANEIWLKCAVIPIRNWYFRKHWKMMKWWKMKKNFLTTKIKMCQLRAEISVNFTESYENFER